MLLICSLLLFENLKSIAERLTACVYPCPTDAAAGPEHSGALPGPKQTDRADPEAGLMLGAREGPHRMHRVKANGTLAERVLSSQKDCREKRLRHSGMVTPAS